MLNVINQFRRIYNDDGRGDTNFDVDEKRLRWSLDNLKIATKELLDKSQTLHDLVLSLRPKDEIENKH